MMEKLGSCKNEDPHKKTLKVKSQKGCNSGLDGKPEEKRFFLVSERFIVYIKRYLTKW